MQYCKLQSVILVQELPEQIRSDFARGKVYHTTQPKREDWIFRIVFYQVGRASRQMA